MDEKFTGSLRGYRSKISRGMFDPKLIEQREAMEFFLAMRNSIERKIKGRLTLTFLFDEMIFSRYRLRSHHCGAQRSTKKEKLDHSLSMRVLNG